MKNILEMLKKHVAIIICLIVAVAAVVANYIPLGGMRDTLKASAEERAGKFSEIDGLLTESRRLPNLDLNSAEAASLEIFPTDAVIARGEEVVKTFNERSEAVNKWVVDLNRKEPLERSALPNPNAVQAGVFLRAYKRAVDTSPAGRANSLPVRLMKAGFAPTSEDLRIAEEQATQRITRSVAVVREGQVVNQDRVAAALQLELGALQDKLVREVAESSMVYVGTDSMDVIPGLVDANTAPMPETIFWAQATLWAQEDLFRGIADLNASSGAKNVIEAPIKHLIKVVVPPQFVGIGVATDPSMPAAPPSADPNAPLTPSFSQSPTGRVSNGLFDVVHAQVMLVVEADRLPQVLGQLGSNRLLSVIHVKSVEPIDPAAAKNTGYYYGDKPCVQVELALETLMMRQWTAELMPKKVKDALGIGEAPAPPPE